MKQLFAFLLMFVSLVGILQAQTIEDEDRIAAAAMKILSQWQGAEPKDESRLLHVVCWTPSDRELPADYHARLTRIMKHIQNFYLQEMKRLGLGARTFNLQLDEDGLLALHKVKGIRPAEHYAVGSGGEIRTECLPVLRRAGVNAERETVLIFCNLATWDEENLRFTHKSPYYAGGNYRNGTAWQLDSPELDTQNLKLRKPLIRDGQYGRISLGKHNSIFIGGIAHELGHALGLPHCKARPDQTTRGTALMGSGNRTYGDELRGEGLGSFLTLAHGLRLVSHPQFSESTKGFDLRATAEIGDLEILANGKSIQVAGTAKGSPPIYAVVAYFDPEGGGDYDSTTACAVPGPDGRFSLSCSALKAGRRGELRLLPLHVNGAVAGQMPRNGLRFSYQVSRDGVPDLTAIQIKQELNPVISALIEGQPGEAGGLVESLKSQRAISIAKRLLERYRPEETPAGFTGDAKTVALTQFKPDSAKVGWGRPMFNRVPDRSMLLESGGEIFETGIYAHAPARHVYDVGSKWGTLHGVVGLASGHGGSVQFEIKGDGKSLWRSKTVKSGTVEFKVSIQGVKAIELIASPTSDGAGQDWGMWFQPTLTR